MFEMEMFGARQASEHLLKGAAKSLNMRPTLWEIREDMFRVIRMTFQSQGRRYGGSWKELTPSWAERKAVIGGDPRILYFRRRLEPSWTRRGNPNMRSRVTRDKIELNSILPYAEVHQFGSEDGFTPPRPYIDFRPRDRQRWRDMVGRAVINAMK